MKWVGAEEHTTPDRRSVRMKCRNGEVWFQLLLCELGELCMRLIFHAKLAKLAKAALQVGILRFHLPRRRDAEKE